MRKAASGELKSTQMAILRQVVEQRGDEMTPAQRGFLRDMMVTVDCEEFAKLLAEATAIAFRVN